MNRLFVNFLLIMLAINGLAQPYEGTIFIESDIINESDSSALEKLNYMGLETRTVYDRRVNDWVSNEAYLFEITWNDGLKSDAVINLEFFSSELAQMEAEKYGYHIGKLPTCLRKDVKEIWIHKGVEPFGGGNNSILIHTGQSTFYEKDDILEETLVHEASHTSLDATHAQSAGWIEAQNLDEEFISDYAKEYPEREDIAESFLLWMAVRYRQDRISNTNFNIITETIPNRLKYFDGIACDMFPIISETTGLKHEKIDREYQHVFFPNPATNIISLNLNSEESYLLEVYNSAGIIVMTDHVKNDQAIDISSLPGGLYIFTLKNKEELIKEKIMKN